MRKISAKKLKALGGKMPFSTIASPRKAVRKSKRKPSEFARIYGSKARVEWVKSLPCGGCYVAGYTENAHLTPKGEKGTGYKGHHRFIAPLCGPRPLVGYHYHQLYMEGGLYIGCHRLRAEYPVTFAVCFPGFNPERAAAETQIAWKSKLQAKDDLDKTENGQQQEPEPTQSLSTTGIENE